MKIRSLILALTCMATGLSAQIMVTSPPPLGELEMGDLYNVSLTNTSGQPATGRVYLYLTDGQSEILHMESDVFSMAASETVSNLEIPWLGPIVYGSSPRALTFQSTGILSPGDYMYCFDFLEYPSDQSLGEFCQEYVQGISGNFELISPYDTEEISTLYPVLSWENYWPFTFWIGGTYSLQLKELNTAQTYTEAMSLNAVIFEASGMLSPSLLYPLAATSLEYDQPYVWQVSAISASGEVLAATSIWSFEIIDPMTISNPPPEDDFNSYPLISDHSKAIVYVNQGDTLMFAYDNWNGYDSLNYDICLLSDPSVVIGNLPVIPLIHNLNTIQLDTSGVTGLLPDEEYCLIVRDGDKHHIIRFITQEE